MKTSQFQWSKISFSKKIPKKNYIPFCSTAPFESPLTARYREEEAEKAKEEEERREKEPKFEFEEKTAAVMTKKVRFLEKLWKFLKGMGLATKIYKFQFSNFFSQFFNFFLFDHFVKSKFFRFSPIPSFSKCFQFLFPKNSFIFCRWKARSSSRKRLETGIFESEKSDSGGSFKKKTFFHDLIIDLFILIFKIPELLI